MIGLAVLHGALLVAAPSAPLIALGVWWNSNTISHNFVHRPFFRRRALNICFGAYLSVLIGIPQAWWRARHLAHHGIAVSRRTVSGEVALQTILIVAVWSAIAWRAPTFFLTVYLPGFIGGLLLCAVHGHYEHARGTTSHYGALYNTLCFNDGYHVEHHQFPGVHWTRLPERRSQTTADSRWPAPLRWMELFTLEGLERLTLRCSWLRRFMLRTHADAFRAILERRAAPGDITEVAIVGGGLFPRTALVLKRLIPTARLTIIDANRDHLERARRELGDAAATFVHARYTGEPGYYDLVVVPLAFDGDRQSLYTQPPAQTLVVHDWIWRPIGISRIVSPVLFKRLNMVQR